MVLLIASLLARQAAAISYSGDAKPVGAVLQEISAKTGMHLAATAEANREIVLVRVNELPTQTFFNDLARATSCRWEQDGDTYYLQPDAATRAKEEQDEVGAKATAIQKELQEQLKALDKQGKPDEQTVETIGFGGFGGSDNPALLNILKQVDPSELASIGPGDRKVWATNNPTASQMLLTGDSGSLITDWIAKHNAEVAKAPQDEATVGQFEQFLPQEMKDMIRREQSPVKSTPAKALLAAQTMPFVGSLQVKLTVYDSQGNPLIDGMTMLNSGSSLAGIMEQVEQVRTGKTKQPDAPKASTKIEYSDDSKLLMSGSGQMSVEIGPGGGGSSTISRIAPNSEKFGRPDLKDPLSYIAQDRLLAIAKLRGKQIIADVPESYAGFGVGGGSKTETAEQASADLDKGETVRGTTDGDVMLVMSSKPDHDRQDRMDRPSMAKLIAQQAKERVLSLDEICEFAQHNPPPMDNTIEQAFSGTLASTLMSFSLSGGMPDWDMYRLYGSLDPGQRQALKGGGSVPFASMSGAQLEWVQHLVMGASAHLRSATEKVGADFMTQMMTAFGGMSGNGKFEPTEVMPNGVPAAGYLTCDFSTEPVVEMKSPSLGEDTFVAGPGEIAMFKMVSGLDPHNGSGFQMPTSGLLGQRTNLAFVFHVSGYAVQDERLSDNSIAADAANVSLSSLPSDLQSQVDEQMKELKKSPLGMLQSLPMFRNTPPP